MLKMEAPAEKVVILEVQEEMVGTEEVVHPVMGELAEMGDTVAPVAGMVEMVETVSEQGAH